MAARACADSPGEHNRESKTVTGSDRQPVAWRVRTISLVEKNVDQRFTEHPFNLKKDGTLTLVELLQQLPSSTKGGCVVAIRACVLFGILYK